MQITITSLVRLYYSQSLKPYLHVTTAGFVRDVILGTDFRFCPLLKVRLDRLDALVPAARFVAGIIQRPNLGLCIPLQLCADDLWKKKYA